MTDSPLLSTKFLLPPPRPGTVPRPRLISRLMEGLRLGRRLTLVSAPPGFGKTTLLREWAASAGRPTAWVSLDENDNQPGLLTRYLVAAVRQAVQTQAAQPGQARPLPGAAEQGDSATVAGEASHRALLVDLINDLAQAGTELLLVLDDYHAIRDFEAHELVAYLLANQPPGLHVAIGTREDPPLPLARLRARDQLTEVRELALRFSADEGTAFLGTTLNLGLSRESVAALMSRTEGWITGLQLAGLALRRPAGAAPPGDAADRFVAAFAGDDRYVVDYLMAEVLERTPQPLRDYLRQTCVLDRLSAPLCDAVTGRDDSQALLEQLEAANLFVISLDNHREWYRFHVLFAEVLRLALPASGRAELHSRAARWFQANGWPELALQQAQLAERVRVAFGAAGHAQSPARTPSGQGLIEPLSEREREVLALVAEGCSNAEIAQKLYIATGTVKRHINNIYGKLGAASRTQAIARARGLGILE